MWNKVKSLDWLVIILCLSGLKALVDANMAQATIVVSFCVLKGYKDYLERAQAKDINEETIEQLNEMRSVVSGIAMKNAAKPQQMREEVRRFF